MMGRSGLSMGCLQSMSACCGVQIVVQDWGFECASRAVPRVPLIFEVRLRKRNFEIDCGSVALGLGVARAVLSLSLSLGFPIPVTSA